MKMSNRECLIIVLRFLILPREEKARVCELIKRRSFPLDNSLFERTQLPLQYLVDLVVDVLARLPPDFSSETTSLADLRILLEAMLNLPSSCRYIWIADDEAVSVAGPFNQLWCLVRKLCSSLLEELGPNNEWSTEGFLQLIEEESRGRERARVQY